MAVKKGKGSSKDTKITKKNVAQAKKASSKKKKQSKKVIKSSQSKTKKKTKKSSKDKYDEYVQICPECGSVDIFPNQENPLSPALPEIYSCNSCGHTSHIFPEIEIRNIDFFRKQIIDDLRLLTPDNTDKFDVSYGRFEVNIMWKLFGPTLFLIGIIMLMSTQNNELPLMYPILILIVSLFMIYTTYLVRH